MAWMALLDAHDMTDCERRLARAAGTGDLVDLGENGDDDPCAGAEWGPERTVRAEVLYQLLVGEPGARAVVLRAARISGGLNLEAGTLRCPLLLEGCFFDGPINLRQARAEVIRLTGCRLTCLDGTQLELRGDLQLNRSTGTVINLHNARVGGQILLNGAVLSGGRWPLELNGTTLASFDNVSVGKSRLERVALLSDGITVYGGVFCREGFVAEGEVRLIGAHIRGQVNFDGAHLSNQTGPAMNADSLKIDRGLFCREGFVAEGEVRLIRAHIRGQVNFDGAHLSNQTGPAMNADSAKVDGGMFCQDRFVAEGEVRLRGAHVQGQLSFTGASLANADGVALNLYEAEAPGSLWLRFAAAPRGAVSLRSARVGALYDSEATWPGEMYLRALTYGHIEAYPDVDARARLRWVERDPEGYAPQPYEQLVAFYRRAGQEPDARTVAIEKQRRRRGTLRLPGRAWSIFLDATVGHGYRTWRAGLWLIVLWAVGVVVFGLAYPDDFKAAKPTDQIPAFNALLYSLDVILPGIDIKQEDAWTAEGLAQVGALLTIAGWVLATTMIAALTGLLKKD